MTNQVPTTISHTTYDLTNSSSPNAPSLPSAWFNAVSQNQSFTYDALVNINDISPMTISTYTLYSSPVAEFRSLNFSYIDLDPVIWNALPLYLYVGDTCQTSLNQLCTLRILYPPYISNFTLHEIIYNSTTNMYELNEFFSQISPGPLSPMSFSFPQMKLF